MITLALIGRPNVGKSTLFNKLAGKKISIIEDTPGITRDRIYEECNYRGKKFGLIDTGGIDYIENDFNKEIITQAQFALNEADSIIFIVDGKNGITKQDNEIAIMIRKKNKNVFVAINKIDNKSSRENIYDFYELGFDNYYPISAEHSIGISDMLDEILKDEKVLEEVVDERLKFCLIGRPNVGKSSIVNALLNEERVIVSDVAGTTRDAIDTVIKYEKQEYVLIDTAGMRKKGKIYDSTEKYSLFRSEKAIVRSDVCVVVINADEGIIEHDKHIVGYALEKGKALVLVVNKCDLVDKETLDKLKNDIKNHFIFISYVKVVYTSAVTKKNIYNIMKEVLISYENSCKEIKTSLLNDIIEDAVKLNAPPSYKGKRLKIYFVNQMDNKPPKFCFNVNNKGLVHFSYHRYLENKLRENIDFSGTPIIIQFKNKGEQL